MQECSGGAPAGGLPKQRASLALASSWDDPSLEETSSHIQNKQQNVASKMELRNYNISLTPKQHKAGTSQL